MKFDNYEGNSKLTDRLENAVKGGRISHAYVFEAAGNIDKKGFAKCFIKGILCPEGRGESCGKCPVCDKVDHYNHEDVIYIRKDGLSVKDAAISEMQEKLKVKPLESRNVVVIEDADTMTTRAQNRLLKTLEEPPGDSVIIILSENMENLTQTILSRCVKYRINEAESSGGGIDAENASKVVEMLLKGRDFHEIRPLIEEAAKDKYAAVKLLDEMQLVYRNIIMKKQLKDPIYNAEDIYEGIYAAEETRRKILQGLSPAYMMKKMLLSGKK